jgi:hypothetical protein
VALYIVRREDEQIHGLVLVRHQERQGVAIHQEFLEKKSHTVHFYWNSAETTHNKEREREREREDNTVA